MSGARAWLTTAYDELAYAAGGRYALCTMCIGGRGIALVIERV